MSQLMLTLDGWKQVEIDQPAPAPEFKFSPRKAAFKKHAAKRIRRAFRDSIEGPMAPPMITNPRRLHEPRKVSKVEAGHRSNEPFFKTPIKQTGFVAPINSLEGMDHFLGRVAEIERLTKAQKRESAAQELGRMLVEQEKELPSLVDEFKANGFQAVSLDAPSTMNSDGSVSSRHEAMASASVKSTPYGYGLKGWTEPDEYGTRRPIYYDLAEVAPILRRIEWEQFALACGLPMKVALKQKPSGGITAFSDDKRLDPLTVAEMGKKIAKATPLDEFINNRERAAHYGVVGSITYGVLKGFHYPEQSMDELGIEDMLKPDEFTQGPQELGLHGGQETYRVGRVPIGEKVFEKGKPKPKTKRSLYGHASMPFQRAWAAEPSEDYLWPNE